MALTTDGRTVVRWICFVAMLLNCLAQSNVHSALPVYLEPQTTEIPSPCLEGHFQCNGTDQCVEQRQNCDAIIDCDNGSDEWNCDDAIGSLFYDHLFRKQPAARSDDIPMGVCYWDNLNTSCACRANEMHCRLLGLHAFPTNLPEDFISLVDLTGNHFPILKEEFFVDLPWIETLVLKHCTIERIEQTAFKRIPKMQLEVLYLDQNKIKSLPERLFPEHNVLKELILSGNQIRDLRPHTFDNLHVLELLDLRNNEIVQITENVLLPLWNLTTLYLNQNNLKTITPGIIPRLVMLRDLSLAENQIQSIEVRSFDLPNLEQLYLSGNRLMEIRNNTFCGLPSLLGLTLNDNEIVHFELEAFACLENLSSLDLKTNEFRTMDRRVLMNLRNLNFMYFSWFHLCRAALHVRVCEPKGDGISSTRHLLDNEVLRASVWVMAIVGIVGNLVVLFGRYLSSSRSHVEHSLYLRHLAASDLLMGVYLAAIASADIAFRGEYIIHEETWRESAACATCGFLSTLSCQSSTLLLTLVTWDRLVSVTRPLQPRNSGKAKVALRLTVLWGASVAAAAAPFSSATYFGTNFYGNNGVCLSLHIHDPYAKGWEYSAGLFIVINTFSLIFIVVSYFRMLQAIRGSGEAMRSTLSGRENIVARRFAVIVATDCACWLPVIIVKLVALAGVKISPSLYAWLAVLVLPVNSALNPVLYTLTTATFKQQVTKYFYSLPCSASGEPRTQTGYESALSISLGHFTSSSSRKRLIQRRISYV